MRNIVLFLYKIGCAVAHIDPALETRIKCARCKSSFDTKDPKVRSWLKAPCSDIGSEMDRPTVLPYESMHIGNQIAHHSHKLMIFRGLVYCKKCGCRGTHHLRKLAMRCEPHTDYGKISLAKLAKGELPPNLNSWLD